MKFLKGLLTAIRGINLTAIGKTFLTGFGFFTRFFGGIILAAVEKIADKEVEKVEDNIDVLIKDKEHAEAAKAKTEKINGAKTDDELNEAFRDSLR